MSTSFSPLATQAKMDSVTFSQAGDAIGTAAAHVPAKKTKTPRTTPKVSPAHKARTKSMSEEQPPPLTLDATAAPVSIPAPEAQTQAEAPALLPEPLLDATEDRFTIFPIRHQDVWDRYKQHMSVIWMAEEIDLSKDMAHWEKLSDGERHFIKNIIGFFAGSDGIVMENLANRFMREVKWPEAKFFYTCQAMIEGIHCVAPETKILTDKGYFEIASLENKSVNVWNGSQFSEVTVLNTSPMAKLLKVKLSNGMFLECTDEHKWLIRTGNQNHPETCKIERVLTKNLKVGDIVGSYSLPTLNLTDPDEFRNPYTHGFFCGDGSYCNKFPQITLYGGKQALLPYLEVSTMCEYVNRDQMRCYITHKINKEKFVVPLNYSVKTQLEWLAGYADADGCTNTSAKGHTSIQIISINHSFLQEVQLMLTQLGVHTNIREAQGARKVLMPDGKGGKKEYDAQPTWCMYITAVNVEHLVSLGFEPHRLKLVTENSKKNASLVRIEEILDERRTSPTYCFNEPLEHAGVFNGILTGQSETYSLLIDTYIHDPKEKRDLFDAIKTIPCVQKKADWALAWIDNMEASFATRLLAFAVIEGIFFSGAFCAIFWLKQRGLMPGLTVSNEFIARDEGLHTDFACLLYSKITNRLTKQQAHKIVREAVKIEKQFITKSLPCELIGMNAKLMSQYIEFVADRLLLQLGYPKAYSASNPFSFMERISLENKDNFFEKRVTTYAKASVGKDATKMVFDTAADF